VTTMLAQSTLNMMSGAQSRRAALVSASTITAAMFAFAPYFAHIPIPALTGVLCAVTWKMIAPQGNDCCTLLCYTFVDLIGCLRHELS
jgi:MFS superfamily sulfate permease-like transporter